VGDHRLFLQFCDFENFAKIGEFFPKHLSKLVEFFYLKFCFKFSSFFCSKKLQNLWIKNHCWTIIHKSTSAKFGYRANTKIVLYFCNRNTSSSFTHFAVRLHFRSL
jgi:hypothetical protein